MPTARVLRWSAPLVAAALTTTLTLATSTTSTGTRTSPERTTRATTAIDFETATIGSLNAMLASRQTSAVKLATAYVDRIEQVNTRGPSLRAVQSIVSTWREQAKASDKRRARGQTLGPLDGIPVIVKDNFDIAGEPTTAGSLALIDNVAQDDATVVRKLRAQGAVIIAKATMVEFAFWNGDTSWGYSSLGGQPLNPYDAAHETSGSSAGSGIAAAAGLAAITFGSDTGGSVITPAERMSLVGYRPTTGMSSRTGIVPVTTFSDTAGVLGRTVTDTAIGATAIAGVDPSDPMTAASAPYQGVDYAAGLSTASLQGRRIGVAQGDVLSADQQTLWDAAVAAVERQGATVVPVTLEMTTFPFGTTTFQFRENLDRYLAERTADDFPIKSVTELAGFYRANPQDTQKYGAGTLFAAEQVDLVAGRAASDDELERAQGQARSRIDTLIADSDLDALLFPETSTVHLEAALGSYPEIALPAGYLAANRHPFSVVLMGKRWADADLFNYSYSLEQATRLRQTPSQVNPAIWRCVRPAKPAHEGLCLP